MDTLRNLFVMRHPDEDIRRRGQNLLTVLWGLLAITILSIPITLLNQRTGSLINIIVAIIIAGFLINLTQRGYVDQVGLLTLICTTISLMLIPLFGSEGFNNSAYFFIINIMIAGMVLHAWAIWVILGMNLVGMTIMVLIFWALEPATNASILQTSINAGLLQIFAAVVAVVNARATMHALRTVQMAHREVDRANQALTEHNSTLEQQVTERTAALSKALATSEAHTLALEVALDEQERMQKLITDLSLPVLPVGKETLVVPLVGALDGGRSALLLQRVMQRLECQRARRLILDITGLAMIDHQVAKTLIVMAQTARLLGTRVTLVGIRPEVAQTLVSLNIDLSDFQTYATLEQALASQQWYERYDLVPKG